MATQVKLPDLGEGVLDATISRWLVKEGDSVNEGDVLLEVATDKVDTEVPAPASGTLLKINHGEGDIVDANTVLAVIGAAGEEVAEAPAEEAAEAEQPAPAQTQATPAQAEQAQEVTEAQANGAAVKASPVAKRVAADKGVELGSVPGTGPG
ncbi:MAG: 2-oxoglutarate dehydrogenase, E2 component, dihydrolipoamide succinyltransferase, partial [Chloroflexi bacterium]